MQELEKVIFLLSFPISSTRLNELNTFNSVCFLGELVLETGSDLPQQAGDPNVVPTLLA